MTTLNKRQSTAVENFLNSKLSTTDIEMMQTATQPSKIGESVFLTLEVEVTDGENKAKQYIFKEVQNINSPASNLSAMIDGINTASKRFGYNYPALLTIKDDKGEEFYIEFKSGFFEAKASIFLKTVTVTAGYLMQGAANLINLLAFLAVAEGKTTAQMEQLGFLYADNVQKLQFGEDIKAIEE
jgi:hypothetical protein